MPIQKTHLDDAKRGESLADFKKELRVPLRRLLIERAKVLSSLQSEIFVSSESLKNPRIPQGATRGGVGPDAAAALGDHGLPLPQ